MDIKDGDSERKYRVSGDRGQASDTEKESERKAFKIGKKAMKEVLHLSRMSVRKQGEEKCRTGEMDRKDEGEKEGSLKIFSLQFSNPFKSKNKSDYADSGGVESSAGADKDRRNVKQIDGENSLKQTKKLERRVQGRVEEISSEQVFQGKVELLILPPANQAVIQQFANSLSGINGVNLLLVGGSTKWGNEVVIFLEKPVELVPVLIGTGYVENVFKYRKRVGVRLKQS